MLRMEVCPWVSYVMTDEFSVRVTDITSRIGVTWTHSLPLSYHSLSYLFLDSMKLPWFQKYIYQIVLNHLTLWDLALPIFEIFVLISVDVNLSLNQILLPLCETNLEDSIDCSNYSVRGYLSLIQKDPATYLHDFAVYVNEGTPLAHESSLESSEDSFFLFSTDFTSFDVFYYMRFSQSTHLLIHCLWGL